MPRCRCVKFGLKILNRLEKMSEDFMGWGDFLTHTVYLNTVYMLRIVLTTVGIYVDPV